MRICWPSAIKISLWCTAKSVIDKIYTRRRTEIQINSLFRNVIAALDIFNAFRALSVKQVFSGFITCVKYIYEVLLQNNKTDTSTEEIHKRQRLCSASANKYVWSWPSFV